jgi:RND family efflux transporter MFP subunit
MTVFVSSKKWLPMSAICALIFLSACGKPPAGSNPMGGPGMGGGGGVPVTAMTVHEQMVPQSQDYQGNLISRHSIVIQPRVAGQIASVYVKPGDFVRQGTPLLQIDAHQQQASYRSSRADAAALQANIRQAQDTVKSLVEQSVGLQSAVALNQKMLTRYQNLFSKGAGNRQDVEQYTNALQKAKADLASNQAQIQAQKSAVTTARKTYERALAGVNEQSVLLNFYKITAPIAGKVGEIPVKVGNYVNTDAQLLSITENSQLELNIGLPAERAFELKSGLPVEIMDNNQKPVLRTKLSFISPVVDPNTQTILVKALLNNPNELLKANQSVKTRVFFSEAKGITVPTGAVSHLGGQDFVYLVVKKDGKDTVKQQPVVLGKIQSGDQYVVEKGLKHGDVLVSQGIQKLMDGAPVTVLPQKGQ